MSAFALARRRKVEGKDLADQVGSESARGGERRPKVGRKGGFGRVEVNALHKSLVGECRAYHNSPLWENVLPRLQEAEFRPLLLEAGAAVLGPDLLEAGVEAAGAPKVGSDDRVFDLLEPL